MSIKPDQLTIPARLRARTVEHGSGTAIQTLPAGIGLTFGAWDARSDAAAHGLAALGLEPGSRVLLPVTTGWLNFAVAYVAVLKAGATAVPVLASHGEEHVRWAHDMSQATGVISDSPVSGCRGWYAPVSALESGAKSPLTAEVRAGDDAQIIFTSGTTGRPKGVVATHENMVHTLVGRPRGGAKTVLHSIPPATNAGQGLLLQPLSSTPHTVMVLPDFRAEEFLAAIEAYRPTDIVIVPAMALALLRARGAARRDLASVRAVRTSSAPITPAALGKLDAMFPNAVTVNMYASTESWPARVRTRFDPARPASIGRPEGTTRVRVVGADGRQLPAGTMGEVQLRAEGVPPRRYLGDPQASASVFGAGGWVRTGDRGFLDEDGYLYLHDREDDIVISGGINVSTLEVAAVLEEHPRVIEAAAVGMPHDVLGHYVAAVIRAAPGLDLADLYSFARERLGPAKAPRRIAVADELPRTPTGKVIKDLLPRVIRAISDPTPAAAPGSAPPGATTEKASATAEKVSGIWADVLDRPVTAASDFLEVGGTSLEASQITVRIRRELGKAAREDDLYRAGTLAEYVRFVLAAKTVDATTETPIKRLARRNG